MQCVYNLQSLNPQSSKSNNPMHFAGDSDKRKEVKVLLYYQRHKISRKWDKFSLQPSQLKGNNCISVPNRWVCDVNGFKSMFQDKETLTKYLLPVALVEYPSAFYQKDACITAHILDIYIEFKVVSLEVFESFNSTESDFVTFEVEYDKIVREIKYSNAETAESESDILFPEINERLNLQCNIALNAHLFSFHDLSQISKRSVVICGPTGSGKSHFLARWCYQQNKGSQGLWLTTSILQMDATSTKSYSTNHSDEITQTNTFTKDETNSSKFSAAIAYLKSITSLIGTPEHVNIVETLTPTNHACIIVIDNFDVSIQSRNDNNDSESSDTRSHFHLQLSHCIFSLVELLSDPTFSSNLFLIASSQLDAHQLYGLMNSSNTSSTTRCPDFELVLPLPRLPHDIRKTLVGQLLLTHQLAIESSTIEAHANKIADMTRGFTPGSIVKVFQEVLRVREKEQKLLSRLLHMNPASSQSSLLATFFEAAVSIRRTSEQSILQRFNSSSDSSNEGNGINNTTPLTFDDFAGYEEVKVRLRRLLSSLKATTNTTATTATTSSSMDISGLKAAVVPVRGVVLHGAVGCGKTLLAQVLAAEAQMAFLPVRSTQLLSKYFGDTEAQLRLLFRAARDSAPSVLFFDDFDVLARHRGRHHTRRVKKTQDDDDEDEDDDASCDDDGDDGDGGDELQSDLQGRVLSTFLNELDGIHSTKSADRESSVLVVVACRHIRQLDDALLRPGRLQVHIHLGKPDKATVLELMTKYLAHVPCGPDVQIADVVEGLMPQRPSCAQAKAVCTDAIMAAIREDIQRLENSGERSTQERAIQQETASYGRVCQRHFTLVH